MNMRAMLRSLAGAEARARELEGLGPK